MPLGTRQCAAAVWKSHEPNTANLARVVASGILVQPSIKVTALDAISGKSVDVNKELIAIRENVVVLGPDRIGGCSEDYKYSGGTQRSC